MFNKGIKIMDNSYLEKSAQYYSNSNEVIFRKIILDFEIAKTYFSRKSNTNNFAKTVSNGKHMKYI